jgi:hypothetical protein
MIQCYSGQRSQATVRQRKFFRQTPWTLPDVLDATE